MIGDSGEGTARQDQIAKAIKGVETMNYPGLKNVWTRAIKMQLPDGYKSIFVMEFESEQALKSYADSPAQKAWYDVPWASPTITNLYPGAFRSRMAAAFKKTS